MSILKILNSNDDMKLVAITKSYISGYCEFIHENSYEIHFIIKLFDDNKFSLMFENGKLYQQFLKELDKWYLSEDKSTFLIKTHDRQDEESEKDKQEANSLEGLLSSIMKSKERTRRSDYVDSFEVARIE